MNGMRETGWVGMRETGWVGLGETGWVGLGETAGLGVGEMLLRPNGRRPSLAVPPRRQTGQFYLLQGRTLLSVCQARLTGNPRLLFVFMLESRAALNCANHEAEERYGL